jgi:ketol-acid reductoisomerase
MTVIYYEEDANPGILADKVVAIIGYGSLGRAVALNLRDSGVAVVVGEDVEGRERAAGDGFFATGFADAARQAHIVMLLLPDEHMTRVYMNDVSPNLNRGETLIFASAYNVAFGFIEPPPFVDVGLIAPRVTGETLRKRYLAEEGFLSFVAVGQDSSRAAWECVLAVALALGSLRAGAVEVSVEQEAEINLFIQQAIIPAFHNIILTAAQLMLQQGYPPEAVLPDLYLAGRFTDYVEHIAHSGLLETLRSAPLTEQYGTLSRLERFSELKLERLMEVTLDEIRDGKFAREWMQEHADGQPRLTRLRKQHTAQDLWDMEQQTIDLLLRPDESQPY